MIVRQALLGLLLAGAGAALAARPDATEPWRAADLRLRAGMPLVAQRMAEQCLASDPAALGCAEVLGRAASYTGACERGLAALQRVRSEGGRWTPDTAIAEGVCRIRTEDLDGALAAFDEAAILDPADQGPWVQRALVDVRLGRLDDLDRDVDGLDRVAAASWAYDLVEVWRAWAADDPALDGLLYAARDADHPVLRQHVALVDCQRWIDLGDPFEAERAASRAHGPLGGNARLDGCRGEAVRLQGDPVLAARIVGRAAGTSATPGLHAVLARALVDQGRLREAADVVAALPDPRAAAAVASAWYLARAEGDEARRRRLEGEAARLPTPADRALDRLVPVVGPP